MSSDLEPHNLFSTKGLVAVVTGGGTGIGLMMAASLENNGATVYIVGRRKDVLDNAAKEYAKYGRILPIQGDVTSRDSLLSVVSTIESQSGYINLLVNNAGLLGPAMKSRASSSANIKDLQKMLWEATPEEFQQTFNVNVTAVYFTTVAFLELLHKGNDHQGVPGVTSQVITVSSASGFMRGAGNQTIAYAASKAAAIHLGKNLSSLFKDWGIRSNVITPGLYPSEMSAGFYGDTLPAHVVPLGRVGTAEDMGGLILYLASRAGGYVNGNVSVSDGGILGLYGATY